MSKEKFSVTYSDLCVGIAEILKTNPHVNFTVSGRGNISQKSGGDTMGGRQFQFSKVSNSLVRIEGALGDLYSQNLLTPTEDSYPLFTKFPFYQIRNNSFLLGFKESVVGHKNSEFFTDVRRGPFFAGFEASRLKTSYKEEKEMLLIVELRELSKTEPEKFFGIIEGLCRVYIPAYYQDLVYIAESLCR